MDLFRKRKKREEEYNKTIRALEARLNSSTEMVIALTSKSKQLQSYIAHLEGVIVSFLSGGATVTNPLRRGHGGGQGVSLVPGAREASHQQSPQNPSRPHPRTSTSIGRVFAIPLPPAR
ncbi:hypothetical protein Dda_6907 [Drechslerella dactyloides]|uniref:Uncharacterized protein n=1 Tax=Drechslerella dactyloides TaxID=74499 RepID=A0AAD6NH02_DREDA|nr:hypothetical protein Dda_6907 [Drechslerella dactyloides]